MKVLIMNHFPLEGSGSGIYTKNLARELSERGNQVTVIYPEHENKEYEGFKSRVIKFNNGKGNNYDVDFNFPCFTTHPISNNTYYNLSEDQIKEYVDAFYIAAKEEIELLKPDVIHAQHLWITPYIASKFDIPYVVTAHGTDLKGFVKDERYHKYAIEGAQKASKIITISNQVDREVTELYKIKNNKELIMNGYDENLFVRTELNIKDELKKFGIDKVTDHIVSFAGKLADFKGVDVLLRAAKIYENKLNKNVTTIIAGDGQLREPLLKLKEELGLLNVHFIGHVTQEQLVTLYNIADVSTVPSRTEPFGLVAIEALACGTPVVGTNQGGLPDFINSKVGTLVPVEDYQALADGIVNEIFNLDKKERSDYCYSYALNNFSWKKSLDKVEKVYEDVIK
ncbi:glycosyltransferase [Clostridiaceae bacterium HSG29]|nr:glycosyltransferase [Clostridiaceae bacterium HSG29]